MRTYAWLMAVGVMAAGTQAALVTNTLYSTGFESGEVIGGSIGNTANWSNSGGAVVSSDNNNGGAQSLKMSGFTGNHYATYTPGTAVTADQILVSFDVRLDGAMSTDLNNDSFNVTLNMDGGLIQLRMDDLRNRAWMTDVFTGTPRFDPTGWTDNAWESWTLSLDTVNDTLTVFNKTLSKSFVATLDA